MLGSNYFYTFMVLALFWVLSPLNTCFAQQDIRPFTIETRSKYLESVKNNAEKEIVSLRGAIPGLVFDFRYSKKENFTGQKLYPEIEDSYLRQKAAKALASVQKSLQAKGLGLKVWDAYRPYSATIRMWQAVPDERYAANPKNGSGHNRGTAIDLTLIDLGTNQELNMGTGFDNFSDTASAYFKNISIEERKNRDLLIEEMQKEGFIVLSTEWWHFYLPDSKNFELLNIPFRKMKKLAKRRL